MNKLPGHILIIDDDPGILQTAKFILKQHYTHVEVEKDPRKIPFLVQKTPFDVILLDMNFKPGVTSGIEGLEWLKKIGQLSPETSTVMITAYGEVTLAVEAMKYGAVDFIVKPWENEKLTATVASVFQLSISKKEINELKTRNKELSKHIISGKSEWVGNSQPILQVQKVIEKVAPTDANVIVLGENGTGKELAAKLIHSMSERNSAPFIKVDLGAIPSSLFESELFGHSKGAFTDAKEERIGRFELASGGTLFLDEIGNTPLSLQSKLLSAIQSREIYRVGSSKPIPVDIRIICASNQPISELVATGDFREDLYYRLNTFEIILPPLRERTDDIKLLCNHFLKIYAKKYAKEHLVFTLNEIEMLENYKWPGNIRELGHTIERAVILAEDDRLTFEQIAPENNRQLPADPDSLNLDELEKRAIQLAIAKYQGNMSRAAHALGIGRTTLYRKRKKYGL